MRMTNQEAIETIKANYPPEKYSMLREALDMTMAMLKEQEPKQIIQKLETLEYSNGSFNYFAEWYCPHCNMLILRGFNDPSIKFCYRCGKPILWEKTVK